ncbi:10139_t:CDS:2 [Racocetra persica]|uniref:10139_t:CDS:1 n=1 Tax=Racocetra persica TaxID=160502 RepID=A0ACA9RTF5_9GLOM|nr:10139_t:CDS:2 [Racocetra persica]
MSNNSPCQSQESTESNSENSIKQNVNLDALQKSTSNKTKSKVAVMEYIHLNSNIPVPKVYYWNSSVNNPHGKKKMFLLKIINIQLELKKLSFSKIGSIFFDGKNDQFKIGQVIESDFFTGERATLSTMERGSFNTTNEYILAVIRNQILYHYTFKSIEQQKY